jgi:class 3 adenylate cyclase
VGEELREWADDAIPHQNELSAESVQQMLLLAERVREAHGGELDDAAIAAVAEATGAPTDYVRVLVQGLHKEEKRTAVSDLRNFVLQLDPDVRRYVASGFLAMNGAFLAVLQKLTQNPHEFWGILSIIALGTAVWNVSLSRDSRVASMCGALFGGIYFAAESLFATILRAPGALDALLLIPFTLGGAIVGQIAYRLVNNNRHKLGLKDPVKERQELLQQLVDLQDRLKAGEQSMTFLSVDIVGSTKMKEIADPLSVEFTFTEYHKFVEMIAKRYGGAIHSTAGDGITAAFDHPQRAFSAARTIQAGLIELNTHRNKIGKPITLRCGIHTGSVVSPSAQDITTLNFAHVIDVASHVQKICPPGGVAISEAAAIQILGVPGLNAAQKSEVSGVRARIWHQKTIEHADAQLPPVPTAE